CQGHGFVVVCDDRSPTALGSVAVFVLAHEKRPALSGSKILPDFPQACGALYEAVCHLHQRETPIGRIGSDERDQRRLLLIPDFEISSDEIALGGSRAPQRSTPLQINHQDIYLDSTGVSI